MPCIFDDERRGNGGFQRGPFGVEPKLPPKASKMLDGGPHRLALFSCSEAISIPTQFRVPILDRPWPGLLDVGRYEEQTSPVVRCSFAAVRSLGWTGETRKLERGKATRSNRIRRRQ